MIINAVIESKDGGTLVLDFPRSIYDVYEKLQSVGIRQSPHQITLSDEEGDDVRVKLYSEDETGKHLLLTLKEQNSLADANMLAFMVDNAKPDFRSKLEQNLLNDQYSSMQEVTDDIKQMLYESGPVKAVFYCPLVGEVTDEEGFSSPVDGRFLKSYAWAVEEALEADTADDEMDMAEFFDEDDGVKAKLVSAKWGVETYRGQLFGRIECSLKEELTDAETEILTDWISGQNSDGYIRFNKVRNYFSWEFQTQPYKELESRADYLKTNGHWDEVLEVYLEKKNSNDNPDKHSRSLYAETINECFSRYCNHK